MNCRITAGHSGYTIVEVIIVLAVSGALFFSVAVLLSGKQAVTEASQSVRDFESNIQSVVSDVANGYYPTVSCAAIGSGPVTVPSGSSVPGSSGGCIFLGKILNVRAQDLDVISLLGRQYNTGTIDVANLQQARPVKVANASVDLSVIYEYKYGTEVTKIVSLSDGLEYRAIAFISELGSTSTVGAVTGSRSTLLYGVKGTAGSNTTDAKSLTISTIVGDAAELVAQPSGVFICLLSGNGKKAKITVGVSGSQTTTEVYQDAGVGSEC